MTAQSATATQRVKRIELVRHSSEEVLKEVSQLNDLIARRAFEIFEQRGSSPGHDVEDWLRAESELLQPVPLNVTELREVYIVQAEVPGFSGEQIGISVEPRRLLISGKREPIGQEADAQLIHAEWRASQLLRALDLPSAIAPSGVDTTLDNGILTVELPKAQDARELLLELEALETPAKGKAAAN
jgi:HSP20 family protein